MSHPGARGIDCLVGRLRQDQQATLLELAPLELVMVVMVVCEVVLVVVCAAASGGLLVVVSRVVLVMVLARGSETQ